MELMNPTSRPVDVAGGRVLAPGEHGDFSTRDPRVARLLERGTLRRVRRRPDPTRPAAAQLPPQPEPEPDEGAADQEVDP